MKLDTTHCVAYWPNQLPRIMKVVDANAMAVMRLVGGIRIRGKLLYTELTDSNGDKTSRLYRITKKGTFKQLTCIRKWYRYNNTITKSVE